MSSGGEILHAVINARAGSMLKLFKRQERFLVVIDGQIASHNVKMTKSLAEKLAKTAQATTYGADVRVISTKDMAKVMGALLS